MIKLTSNPHEGMRITSEFGVRTINGIRVFHYGIDIGSLNYTAGDPVFASADGTIRVAKIDGAGLSRGWGRYVIIEHEGFCTIYSHLDSYEVSSGQKIRSGVKIGEMGNTGDSNGVHLHFEIRECDYSEIFVNGANKLYSRDPQIYLAEIGEEDEEEVDENTEEVINATNPNEVSTWASASWKKAVAKGILDGTNPKGVLTREQLAVVLDRLGLMN
ncbi:MAG: Peptidase [Clostridiales bacterium]|nr:Peptidase [Clostridiales bacterium]